MGTIRKYYTMENWFPKDMQGMAEKFKSKALLGEKTGILCEFTPEVPNSFVIMASFDMNLGMPDLYQQWGTPQFCGMLTFHWSAGQWGKSYPRVAIVRHFQTNWKCSRSVTLMC